MNTLQELLDVKGFILLDGAMGTMLFEVGLTTGDSPEEWNIKNPEAVQEIHRSYLEVGSDLITTNSFGGSRFRLQLHGLDKNVHEINFQAVQNAKTVSEEFDRPILVAGSMGPSGELLAPLGTLSSEEASEGFLEQGQGLIDGGVDLLLFETFSALEEVEAGILGIREISDIPIAVSMSFDTAGKTMMGISAKQMMERLSTLEVAAIGANCGANLQDTQAALLEMNSFIGDIPLISRANAGIPQWRVDSLQYDGTPDVMATYALNAYKSGASLIGGCCGTTPKHISLMGKAIESTSVS